MSATAAAGGGGSGEIYVNVVDVVYSGEFVNDFWCSQIQIIGRRADGRSVVVRVRGMTSYFYINARSTGGAACSQLEEQLNTYANAKALELEEATPTEAWQGRANAGRAERIRATRIAVKSVRRTSMDGYQFPQDMFCVETSHPHVISMLRDAVVQGLVATDLVGSPVQAYEANVEFVLRFMVDTGVRCHSWIGVRNATPKLNASYCSSPDLVCEAPDRIRPIGDAEELELGLQFIYELLSFDIECAGRRGEFPDPDIDPVIQIACDLTTLDGRSNEEVEKGARSYLLALRDTDAHIVGDEVTTVCFTDEKDLLLAFAEYIRAWDPDVITSWNGPNFDWFYIVKRTKALGLGNESRMFSRLHRVQTYNRIVSQATKAHGHTETNQVEIQGRFIMDMMDPIMKNYKLRSYKLDDVAFRFLKDRKDDVPHFQITTLWEGTPQDRGKLGHYW